MVRTPFLSRLCLLFSILCLGYLGASLAACAGPLSPSGGGRQPEQRREPGDEPAVDTPPLTDGKQQPPPHDPTEPPAAPTKPQPDPVAPSAPASLLRDVATRIALQFDSTPLPPPSGPSYSDIKPILDQHCVRCHLPIARGGGLDLSAFPFTSALRDETVEQLAARVVARMRAPQYPMPPGEHRPESEISQIESWVQSGLGGGSTPGPSDADVAALALFYRAQGLAAESRIDIPVDGTTSAYTVTLSSLLAGHAYELRLVLIDGDGEVVQTTQQSVVIDRDNDLELKVACPCRPRS